MATGLTSAAGFTALLDENEDVQVKQYALEKLNEIVDQFWPEIADVKTIEKIEVLYEDEKFPARKLAALVASKVFYHLGDYKEAMEYALKAEEYFDISNHNEFVDTLIAKCIDEYIRLRQQHFEKRNKGPELISKELENIVERMFNRCFEDKEYKQAVGIALEARRLDILERCVKQSEQQKELLAYIFKVAMELITSREFRQAVLRSVVKLYTDLNIPDYISICRCLVFLDDAAAVANILTNLLQNPQHDDNILLAFQIGFELCDNATQQFLRNVSKALPQMPEESPKDAEKKETMEIEKSEDPYQKNLRILHRILTHEPTVEFQLEFLYRNNHTDLNILKNIKNSFEARNSILHTATILANALMHCGTTRDTFLRNNLEWLGRAVNWAKFSTTAGLGVIHKGHFKEAMNVLAPYLPRPGSESAYIEGGSLYALGLINAHLGHKISSYLLTQIRTHGASEILLHGGCLGLGLAAMATQDQEIFSELHSILYQDSAVAGEAAGVAIGLVLLGSASENCAELINFAHDTQHEKIIRGIAIGLALIMYGREEEADALISQLATDKDPILRYGGMLTIGMAYCGTANNNAIKQLLHFAVSDVSDDVRRAAVLALGFVMYRQPQQVPVLVQLLAESYNPHVRYGACLAIGVACAGTGLREAIDLLEPLAKNDPVDYVRQGALIALAMVLIQCSETFQPKVTEVRQLIRDCYSDKHQPVMARFGAILAQGIIDAGGRNVTIALSSRSGHRSMTGIVGMVMFLQYWYWYPFIHFISLAFTPTALIGLNKELKMPKFKFKSNAPPSMFAYPQDVEPPKVEAPTKLPIAQLSTIKKHKFRKDRKKKEEEDKMDISESTTSNPTPSSTTVNSKTGTPSVSQEKDKQVDSMETDEKTEGTKETKEKTSEKEKEKKAGASL